MRAVSFVVFVVIATSVRFVCSFGCQKAPKTRSYKNECSFPSDRHSTTLVPIPSRLFYVIDEHGKQNKTYKPGTMWCTSCRKDGERVLKSCEEYKPPLKRKRVSEMNKMPTEDYKQQLERAIVITSSPVFRLSNTIDCVKEQLYGKQSDLEENGYKKLLKTLKHHIQTLCFRVSCLEETNIMNMEIMTDNGKLVIQKDGEVIMHPDVFNRIMSSINSNKESTLHEQLASFQVALYSHYANGGTSLYSPIMMREFTNKVSPGLFENEVKLILKRDHTKERASLQELRAVALFHTLAYFRSQKTSTFQKDIGVFFNQHGLTRAGINTGPVLDISTATRTHDCHVQQISVNYFVDLEAKIMSSLQERKLIINLIDDFHNIHTVHTPSDFKLSFATHMTSNLLDIVDIPAVRFPDNRDNMHTHTTIHINGKEKICRGGIVPNHVKNLT